MRNTIFYKLLLPCIFLLGFQYNVRAQFEEGKETVTLAPIIGNAIAPGANNTLTYSNTGENSRKIKNIISFYINENDNTTYFASGFSATVNFTLETRVTPGSNPVQSPKSLTVNYDKTSNAKYNVRAYLALPAEYEVVKIIVTSLNITGQSGWNPQPMLHLENEMRVLRYYTLSNNPAYLAPTLYAPVNHTDALGVSWGWNAATNNNLTQLEWAWCETEMQGYYIQGGIFDKDMLFLDNSTRIDLDYIQNNFKIPLLYDGVGKLYYRVRAAYRRNDGNVITGPWSQVDSFAYSGHEPNLNWQSVTSFAENGKFNAKVEYFDGSMRSRQAVSKDNTTGNTIVGETIYDLQGRPNVQILPTPTDDNILKFFNDFNRFQGQAINDNPAKYFDLTPAALQCSRGPALDTNYGNGKYYSANNPWLGIESKTSFIPGALGYAFSETRFMDDATQRIRAQGGLGWTHQIGNGRETKYYYGKPSQPELDALFGTEAGDASHYSKNMIRNANGQMSVSYVDMHGRTVATALAGLTTPGTDSLLANAADYPLSPGLIKNHLLTPATNIVRDNSIESISTILVPDRDEYLFTYKLDPAILNQLNCNNQQVCFDCKYDLEISIKSEDCDSTAIIRKYSNLEIVPANQACNTSMGFVGTGVSTATKQIDFPVTLDPGSWIVRKTLTINDSMFRVRRDSALNAFLCKSQQSIYDSVYAILYTSSGCGATGTTQSCDSCLSNLGPYSIFRLKYIQSIGNPPPPYNETEIQALYTQDSLACVQACTMSPQLSTLASLRNQLLADMIPFTGQYALETVANPNALEKKYNIFTDSYIYGGTPYSKPFYYKNPVTENNQPSHYFTEENEVDITVYPNGPSNNTFLTSLTPQAYTSLFQASWAKSLIYYHPEFSKLKFAETTISGSYVWLDKVLACNTYADAVAIGAHNPIANDPYFTNNYVPQDVTDMNRYLTQYLGTQSSNPSIWQLANGIVLCASVPESLRMQCISGKNKTGIQPGISTSDKDKIWEQFKTMYLSYRNDMVVKYINSRPGVLSQADMNTLQNEGKQLAFVTMQGVANQNGWTWWNGVSSTGDTTGTGVYTNNNTNNIDNCIAQRPFWRARLLQCDPLLQLLNSTNPPDTVLANTIINSILDGLVSVCNNSRDAQHPYGASNVRPGYGGQPQTFEQVVNQVFTANGIFTVPGDNYFCNPYSIDFPKPYGKNPPIAVNNTNTIDSCACNRFAALQQEANALGYNPTSFTSMNQFLVANYNDSLSLIIWNGLQRCNELWIDTCFYVWGPADEEMPLRPGTNATGNVKSANKGGCSDPDIVGFIYTNQQQTSVALTYATGSEYSSCNLIVTNLGTGQIEWTIPLVCGTEHGVTGFNLLDCNSYMAQIVCTSVECGEVVSNIAYIEGCNPCPIPFIYYASYLNNTSTNNVSVTYYTPAGSTCDLTVTDVVTLATWNFPLTCGTTTAITLSLPACQEYMFSISSTSRNCGTQNSNKLVLEPCNGTCPDPVLNSVSYINNTSVNNVQVNYTISPDYTYNTLYVYDAGGNIIQYHSVSNANTSITISLPTCQYYSFKISCSGPICGIKNTATLYLNPAPSCVSCTKPVITSTTVTLPPPGPGAQNVSINYTVPSGATNCLLKIFSVSNGYTYPYGTQPINCAANNVVVNLSACYKYRFVIQVNLPVITYGCDMSISDTARLDSCYKQVCDTIYSPITLDDWVVLPAMLNCGYQKPCITCGKLDSLTAEFRQIFPPYIAVPYMDSTATDEQARQNSLWARFLNYRTGFTLKAIDYLVAYKNCQTMVPPPVLAICSFVKPLNDPNDIYPPDTLPCIRVQTQAQYIAYFLYEKQKDSLIAKFDSLYKAKCLIAKYNEEFYVQYKPKEYHYTLYYYDQAGNLVQTLPPAAVRPNYDPTFLANVILARNSGNDHPNNNNNQLLAKQYRYNSMNQVILEKSPEAGVSKFWYDKLGRLAVSQNQKQFAAGKYSYTLYDIIGRIVEVGEKPQSTPMTQAICQNDAALQSWLNGAGIKQQITRTVYDEVYTPISVTVDGNSALWQKNLRNRISYSYTKNAEDQPDIWDAATFYSYDIHGNVDTLLQDFKTGMGAIACTGAPEARGNRFKKMVYTYDLISGKLNDMAYQPGRADEYYHRYSYDAENKLLEVRTSKDKIYWELDAQYNYYRHGLLNRTVLGQNKVQGIDYAYTIQGWLKGINSTDFQTSPASNFDMGQDAVSVPPGNPNRYTGKDAVGFSLNYYNDDYTPIGSNTTPFAMLPQMLPPDGNGISTGAELFNGNVRGAVIKITQLGNTMLYGYRYDQLQRIKRMDAFTGVFASGNTVNLTRTDDYHEEVSYDPSGNIRTYLRNGTIQGGRPLNMDKFTYQYEKTAAGILASNKLRYVYDSVASGNYPTEDINSQTSLTLPQVLADNNLAQPTDNYQYDQIGNLIKNTEGGINNVEWTLYGKIKTISRTDGTVVNYTYDAGANRISKTVTAGGISKSTYYVRDASGKIVSIYYRESMGSTTVIPLNQSEITLYGSTRLGVLSMNVDVQNCAAVIPEVSYFRRGNKAFELVNHLENVIVTVSDKKIAISANSITIDYFTAEVITANDFYPFGMSMPARTYSIPGYKYRYAYNGKELDTDIGPDIYDYGLRISDQRLGRFFSIDPLTASYPWFSPYQFAGNTPIQAVDLDGAEPRGCHMNSAYGRLKGLNVKEVPSQYDNQAWLVKVNGGIQQLMHVYAIQDIDKKTYLIYETATGSKEQWYIEYDKNGYKGDVNAFTWYTPPNPADLLTAITVGPLVAIPGALIYGKALLIYAGEELLEEAVGFPIIPDPGDVWQEAIKRRLRKEAKERAAKASLPEVTVKSTVSPSKYWNKNTTFNGKKVYQRNDLIDANKVDDMGRTNLQRMQNGLAPLGPDGKSVNLHHLIQTNNSSVAEVSASLHQKFYKTLHINTGQYPSGIDRAAFDKWRSEYWKNRAKDFVPKTN